MDLNNRVFDIFRSNRVYLPILFLLGLMCCFATPSLADPTLNLGARMEITVDSETQEIPLILNEEGTGFTLTTQGEKLVFSGGDEVTVHYVRGMFDPILVAAISVIDFGAASSFAVAVAAPLNPPLDGDSVLSVCEIAGTLADGSIPQDGVSVAPYLTDLLTQCTIEGGGILDAGPAFSSPLGITTYPSGGGAVSASTHWDCSLLPDGTCDSFDILISFTGSGGNDGLSFVARHCLDEESCFPSDTEEIKVEICHKPGTRAEKTLMIPESALGGHIGHGDTVGACDSGNGSPSCDNIKPITKLSLVWGGTGEINVTTLGQVINKIGEGDEIALNTDGAGNDLVITISGVINGESTFHLSCSDEDMNGPEDCGKAQGDGKTSDPALINDWLFAGMEGENGIIDCNP